MKISSLVLITESLALLADAGLVISVAEHSCKRLKEPSTKKRTVVNIL